MAKFVEIGKHGAMVNVEQIAYIEPGENKNEYIIHMINGSAYCVTYDEFLEITGQQQHQSSDNKKYAVRVLKRGEMFRFELSTKEIEKLKNDKDLAIDWDKVELEEVRDGE